jgi:hypothetical protein
MAITYQVIDSALPMFHKTAFKMQLVNTYVAAKLTNRAV